MEKSTHRKKLHADNINKRRKRRQQAELVPLFTTRLLLLEQKEVLQPERGWGGRFKNILKTFYYSPQNEQSCLTCVICSRIARIQAHKTHKNG